MITILVCLAGRSVGVGAILAEIGMNVLCLREAVQIPNIRSASSSSSSSLSSTALVSRSRHLAFSFSNSLERRSLALTLINNDAPGEFGALISKLKTYEAKIAEHEDRALMERWHCGRDLLSQRIGKLLPKGLLDKIAAEVKVSRRELKYRMQFAQKYTSPDLLGNAVAQFGSWHEIVGKGLKETSRCFALLRRGKSSLRGKPLGSEKGGHRSGTDQMPLL
jgi:hypothetical protein